MAYGREEVERRLCARQEKHCHSEHQTAPVGYGFKPVGGSPLRDHRSRAVEKIGLRDREFRSEKHHADSHAEKYAAYASVDEKEYVVGPRPENIARFRTELVADSLEDEAEQNQHPEPVGASETRGVEQRERGEESAPEHHQRGERQLPLASQSVDNH